MQNNEKLSDIYSDSEYTNRTASQISADIIVPYIYNIVKPKSVIDVGTGVGTWLSAFKKLDEEMELLGLDGSYVIPNFVLPLTCYEECDLEKRIVQKKRYDLAISLEVAEHLSKERAETFVSDLVSLSDVVLFSAATIYQPGDHHVNCQPADYWNQLFENNNYVILDFIRPIINNNCDIAWWYKNNIFLYVKSQKVSEIKSKLNEQGLIILPKSMMNSVNFEAFQQIVEMEKAKVVEKWKKRSELYYEWLVFKRTGCISNEIIKNGQKVALWGLGNAGKYLYDDLKQENKIDITIIMDIGYKSDMYHGTPVVNDTEGLRKYFSELEVIIVTLPEEMQNITKQLVDFKGEVINLIDLISDSE